jgi:coenzyme F420 hydrogenase subunit beta
MRARTRDGREAVTTYNEFWEGVADWRLQLRCKLCPDAVGLQADVMVCDTWPGGAPNSETDGFNAIVARTESGERLVGASVASGALIDAGPLGMSDLDRFQPQHVARRRAALPRAVGLAARNGVVPRFRGILLLRSMFQAGPQAWLRNFRGSWDRAPAAREQLPE